MSQILNIKKRCISDVFHFFLTNEFKNLDLTRNPLYSTEESVFRQLIHVFNTASQILRSSFLNGFDNNKGCHFASQTFHKTVSELKDVRALKSYIVHL